MTKLLLLNPNFTGVVLVPSLGLGFIGTYVRQHTDCTVEIVEPVLEGLSEEQVLDKARDADIVGLVCYTESRSQCFEFGRRIRQINPGCKIIVGGPHVTTLDERILQHYPFIDAVVRREGEESVLEIVRGQSLATISGITWRDRDRIVQNPDRPLQQDIDGFNYDYSPIFHQIRNWKDFEAPHRLQQLNSIPIIASRGCPFQCAFCAAHHHWGKVYRGVSSNELVARIQHLVTEYNIRYFRFYDALFIGSEDRIIEFCDLLEEAQLDIHFRIDIRVGTSRKILERLREVGCDVVGFGVESGCNRILKRINKGITREKTEQTINTCKELGYWMIGFFMVALPDESMEDINESFKLFKFFDVLNVQFFKIHPNTSFYDELKKKGEIDDDVWFDSSYGFNTEYGNEVYYCKEIFPSARFSIKDVGVLTDFSAYKYNTANPGAVIKRNGWFKGVIIITLSELVNVLLRYGVGRRVYRDFLHQFSRQVYRQFFAKGKKAG